MVIVRAQDVSTSHTRYFRIIRSTLAKCWSLSLLLPHHRWLGDPARPIGQSSIASPSASHGGARVAATASCGKAAVARDPNWTHSCSYLPQPPVSSKEISLSMDFSSIMVPLTSPASHQSPRGRSFCRQATHRSWSLYIEWVPSMRISNERGRSSGKNIPISCSNHFKRDLLIRLFDGWLNNISITMNASWARLITDLLVFRKGVRTQLSLTLTPSFSINHGGIDLELAQGALNGSLQWHYGSTGPRGEL